IQEEEEEVLHIPLIIEEEEEPLLGIPQSEAPQPASDSNTRIGTVTPRIIIQEEEEPLLGLPQPTAEPKDRSPAPVPANPSP
ncbi:MAG TPA: hypothetical protein VLA12_11320, partial [Planctomycetaceae bacterium]|nr:hypothetical protein [Planctomycetaceae bacterium]